MYRYIRVVLILFGISFTALFIQHHVELSELRSEQKSKDVYYPTNSRDRGLQTTRQEFQEYFINVRLSDDIPVNRDIPDSRPDRYLHIQTYKYTAYCSKLVLRFIFTIF